MQKDIITSIDFGSKKLSATSVFRGKEELEILAVKSCKSTGIEKGLLTDVEKCKKNVINLLAELEEKIKKDIKSITIGISSNKARITETTVLINLDEEKVTTQDIGKAIKKGRQSVIISEDESIVDVLINFYMLDGKVIHKDILNWKGRKLELNLTLVIADKKEIQKYYKLFEGTKYNIEFIKLNILAGKQIFLNEKNSIGDIVLVDIGAGITEIALFNNGVPKNIISIPIGGNNITNDLAICGNFSFLEADNIKKIYASNYKSLYEDNSIPDEIEVGTIKVSKKLFYEVVNARIEEILSHINMKLKNTGHYDRICSIILYGDSINYFEDINEIVHKIFTVKTKVITKTDLGMKNSENITSLAIAKEVYDRLNLLEDKVIAPTNKNNDNKVNNEKEHLHNNEGKNHILKKVKVFFDKIF
ncbi:MULTISPECIES: cell division FtsA domain-containing protein [unclassified Clostridium]|uniref:cell division FtsA domain-containing protein n=1 Tax=unclassified Clostridium TaxID=2614128 RepID=UPI0002976EF3|nr:MULTISPECIES: cell division FtsA domain-containing protein [unclassified Clostridium]EKQ53742.1 MAG: actin-like ATPase involved in cell division [Clostridium sp. Maddingley MBC34-26]